MRSLQYYFLLLPLLAILGCSSDPEATESPRKVTTKTKKTGRKRVPLIGLLPEEIANQADSGIIPAEFSDESPKNLVVTAEDSNPIPGLVAERKITVSSEQLFGLPTSVEPQSVVVGELQSLPGGFGGRLVTTRREQLVMGGGTNESELAVSLGLSWLAHHQAPEGHWSLQDFPAHASHPYVPNTCSGKGTTDCDVAGAGLGMLPFLGAGVTHKQGIWKENVLKAKNYLLKAQSKDKGEYRPYNAYGNAIATIAMCELYALTGDPEVKASAQRAIDFMVWAQDPKSGGWRYRPQMRGDTSVTTWHVMALKSAQMAGLTVPQKTILNAKRWYDYAEARAPLEIEQRAGKRTPPVKPSGQFGYSNSVKSPSVTMLGLLSLQYLGAKKNDHGLINGACFVSTLHLDRTTVTLDYLNPVLPQLKTVRPTLVQSLRGSGPKAQTCFDQHYLDIYATYHGTQVMHHLGGAFWQDWNEGFFVTPQGRQFRPAVLLRLDRDHDGLSRDELCIAGGKNSRIRRLLETEWKALEVADANRDGRVTKTELLSSSFASRIPGIRDVIVNAQDKKKGSPGYGSWDPAGDQFASIGGRVMKTSLCLLTLEVYYRHLPLYRSE